MHQIAVSIIIPVFNTGQALIKCVKSMASQSYQDSEIIIIDDGSDNMTARICDNLKNQFTNINVYHKKNEGVSTARNIGIEKAKGKYIFFADGDDYAEPEMLNELVLHMEKNKVDLCIAGYYFDVPRIDNLKEVQYEKIKQNISTRFLRSRQEIKQQMVELWDCSMMYNVWNKLFRRDIISQYQIRFPEKKIFNEDRDFIRKYLLYTNSIYVSDRCFYHYVREIQTSATSRYYQDMLQIRKEEFHLLISFFQKMDIFDEKACEYIAREHFDRVIGTIENIFHGNLNKNEIKQEISKIMSDEDTVYVLKYTKPKSKKMKVLKMICQTYNIQMIYMTMQMIYIVRKKFPILFSKMRQKR